METKLAKELTYLDVTLSTTGFIIGAGIFAIIGINAKYGKNFSWISILLCGLFAIFTGLSYSELASMLNKNGGEYVISKEAYGKKFAKVIACFTLLTEILAVSSVSFGFGSYLSTIIPINETIIAAITLSVFGYINYSGIRNSANYNNFCTIIEVIGLISVGILGSKNITKDQFNFKSIDKKQIYNIILGASYIYFAYFGFDSAIELTEETKQSEKNIPKAIISGILISTLLYLLVSISSVATLGWKNLANSKSPMADVSEQILGNFGGKAIFLIALISMSNSILMAHIGSSRFMNSISKDINLPFNLDKVDSKTRTPKNAIILVTIISLCFLLLGNLENAVSTCVFGRLFVFLLINFAVLLLRKKQPDKKRPFKIPLNIYNYPITSILGCISCIIFIVIIIKEKLYK